MRFAWVGYGLLGVAGTTSLALWLTFRAFEAGPPARRNALAERLQPVDAGDVAWFGAYRQYTETDGFVIEPSGVCRGTSGCNCDPDDHCFYVHYTPVKPGSWERHGSIVRVQSGEGGPAGEVELGLLDGAYVLLSEFCTWRRVSDAVTTTSSSR